MLFSYNSNSRVILNYRNSIVILLPKTSFVISSSCQETKPSIPATG